MYSVGSGLAGGALPFLVVFIWLTVLTFLILRNQKFLSNLFPRNGERDIRRRFEEILSSLQGFDKDLKLIKQKVGDLDRKGLKHIQKVALIRYNPYDDTGGDQSFSLAILDNDGNGMVVTSLHGRSGTRIFAKDVILGKAGKYEFSSEEKTVIKKAQQT